MYAGSLLRPSTNSELHLVDERIVGPMPKSLSFEEAAALPLTSVTAWELLFDRLQVREGKDPAGKLLVIGGASGVGSILIQLTRQLTGLTLTATASRPETQDWVRELGAHYVIDHAAPMPAQLRALGIDEIDYVVSLIHTDKHLVEITEMLAPQGRLGLIDDPKSLDVPILKPKSISLHWELMYTRSLYQTRDMIHQHIILKQVADLVDAGVLRTTLVDHFGTINADNLRRAHALTEKRQGARQDRVVRLPGL